MKLNVNQKKTISEIMADLGKLIFLSFVIGRFISADNIENWHFIAGITLTLIFLISSILIL